MTKTADGECFAILAPPKPEPVLREAWANLYHEFISRAYDTQFDADASASDERVECRRIAWMSDGSPVPGEEAPLIGLSDIEFRRLCDNVEAPLIEERDHWRTKAEALQAEVDRLQGVEREWYRVHHHEIKVAHASLEEARQQRDDASVLVERMTPVVDAAVAWTNAEGNEAIILTGRALMDASRGYQSQQDPAEPGKNCTTCRFCKPIQVGAPCVKCHDASEWRSHHD